MSFMFALYSKFLLIFPRFFSKYSVPTFATTIMKRDSSHIPKVTSNTVSKDVARSSRAKSANSSTSSSSSNRPAGEARPRSSTPPHNRKSSSAPVDMGELVTFVKDAVKQDQVVIFSKTYCPYCTMAKDVFKKMEKPFTVIELDKRDDGNHIQDILKEMTGERTVPRVFLNGECIGGGTDVQAMYNNGTLQNMIVK